jgi:membrane-bound metal-dependent hydrolase YbcI (DUF457 family)
MPRETSSALPFALLPSVVLTIDHVLETCQPSRAVEGLLDELAHVATALALLTPLALNADRATALGALAGAILLDADHVPGELGLRWLSRGTGRPYPHTLLSALILVGLGGGQGRHWRRFAWPVAAGLTTHLLRDLATGGVPLFWPLSRRNVRLPYPLYAVLLAAATIASFRRQGSYNSNARGVS